jgi:transcriptional regulator with XRE-family HTH domain
MSGGYAPIAITTDVATSHATRSVGSQIAALRKQVGWSQRELGRRAGLSQAMVSLVETEQVRDLTFRTAERLLSAIGARLVVAVDAPFLADRECQLEPAHARCSAHVVARLRRSGWETRAEVEVGGDRSRGWIDVLAFHPGLGVLLVIEIKTEIRDFGAIERAIGWYERAGPPASRRFGWRPVAV